MMGRLPKRERRAIQAALARIRRAVGRLGRKVADWERGG